MYLDTILVTFLAALEVLRNVTAGKAASSPFTDEIPFKINWPGADFSLVNEYVYMHD